MLLNQKLPFRYILSKISTDLLYVTIIASVVYTISRAYENSIPDIPLSIPAFLGTAMSIILSFKLSQSYDRWWEARKIWGTIVNESRNLVLQLQSFVKKGNDEIIKSVAFKQIAFGYCLGRSLRGLDPLHGLEQFLTAQERKELEPHTNKSLGILQLISSELTTLKEKEQIDSYSYVQLNQTISNLTHAMGAAERIKTTIFPVTYRLFLHMIIYVFLILLSILLCNSSKKCVPDPPLKWQVMAYFLFPVMVILIKKLPMETYEIEMDILTTGVHVTSFPEGISQAFGDLEAIYGNKRDYFGISWCDENGSIQYYAMTRIDDATKPTDPTNALMTIKKGTYYVIRLTDWMSKTDCIKDLFHQLLPDKTPDATNPCIEWYKSEKEMLCMVMAH